MAISAKTQMCIIIGDPVEHSLSPAMHNAAYKALGIDDTFVFTAARVREEDLETVVKAVRGMGIRGLTCTIPHKVAVMQYLDEVDPIAKKIGAVNTVVNENGVLKGYNTDWLGTISPLEDALRQKHAASQHQSMRVFEASKALLGKKVALIGAGGAARAMAYGVLERGAQLTIFNRTLSKARELVQELNSSRTGGHAEAQPEDTLHLIPEYDIIINSTSLGMSDQKGETPIDKNLLQPHHIVFDAVYAPRDTRLIREAREQGATTIYGLEMLLHQGTAQFELYTGRPAPVEAMRSVLMK